MLCTRHAPCTQNYIFNPIEFDVCRGMATDVLNEPFNKTYESYVHLRATWSNSQNLASDSGQQAAWNDQRPRIGSLSGIGGGVSLHPHL